MLLLLFIIVFPVIYSHAKSQSVETYQIKTELNFSNIDSQIRLRTPTNTDNITEMIYLLSNRTQFNLLSISTTNGTVSSSQTFDFKRSIMDIQFSEEKDEIIAALSSNKLVFINTTSNEPYTFLDLIDCSPKLMTPEKAASIIVACSKHSTSI
eukprot:281023_1